MTRSRRDITRFLFYREFDIEPFAGIKKEFSVRYPVPANRPGYRACANIREGSIKLIRAFNGA